MAAPGNVAATATERLALGVGIGDLLAVRAAPQRAPVDLGEEGVMAGAVAGDEALQLGESLGLPLAPAQVVLPQALLLGRALAVQLAVKGQSVHAVSAQQLAALQPAAPLAHLRPFPESPDRLLQARKLARAVVRNQGRQRLALRVRRLAVGEAGVNRFGQHSANRFQRSALDLIKRATLAFERKTKGIGRRLPELVASPVVAKLTPQALGEGLGVRAQPVAVGLILAALGFLARLLFVVGATRGAEDAE